MLVNGFIGAASAGGKVDAVGCEPDNEKRTLTGALS